MAQKLPKVLTEDEQEALLSQFNTRYQTPYRNLCMVRLMLECGLRVGEVVALRPEHIDLNSGKVMIREGKGHKDRVVWANRDLLELIRAWMDRRPESEYLFPTRNGTKVATRYMRAMVKRMAKKGGIKELERVHPHTLRHTFATDIYRATNDIRLVQKALGHSDLSTTMVYTHIVDKDLEKAMKGYRKAFIEHRGKSGQRRKEMDGPPPSHPTDFLMSILI